MTSSAWKTWGAPLALSFALVCSATAAQAQFFFRPFAHSFDYVVPDDDDGPAPYGSRRAVARILSREGYRLVGPLGHRGEQVVATGVNRREGEMRFFIDPYEGYIIRGVRVGPPPEFDRAPPVQGEYVEPLGGSRPVVRDLREDGRGAERRARRRSAPEVVREATPREIGRPEPRQITPSKPPVAAPQAPVQNVAAPTPPLPATVATPAPKPPVAAPAAPPPPPAVAAPAPQHQPAPPAPKSAKSEATAPAKVAATPAEPARRTSPPTSVVMRPAESPPSVVFKRQDAVTPPAAAAAKPDKAAAAPRRPVAARSTGVSSYRAIVPPHGAAGATVVTPTSPGATTARGPRSAKTPQNVAMPK